MTNVPRRLLCAALALCLFVSLSGCASGEVRAAYRQGRDALDEGRLADAAACFGPLGDYRSSLRYLEDIYREAAELYAAGSYREAAEIFAALSPFGPEDAALYASLAEAQACLQALDIPGALAALAAADSSRTEVTELQARIAQLCFEDTVVIRPEYIAAELADGRIAPEISDISTDRHLQEIVYAMTKNAADSVYSQYRSYCMTAFPESFTEPSDSYFTFQIDGCTYYVCNYHALYGGILFKIPRY